MARDVQTIQADIERARDALATAVDEITDRANPKRLVEQGKQTVRGIVAQPKVKYSLIGAGALLALLLLRRLTR